MTLSPQEQLNLIAAAEHEPSMLSFALVDVAHWNQPPGTREKIKSALSAAAVPHWVDVPFLAALLEVSLEQSAVLAEQLSALNIVEVFPARSAGALNIHESSRKAIRDLLQTRDPGTFRAISQRALDHLASHTADHARIERLYHLFALQPRAAAREFDALDHDLSVRNPEACQALLATIEELNEEPLGRLAEWAVESALLSPRAGVGTLGFASTPTFEPGAAGPSFVRALQPLEDTGAVEQLDPERVMEAVGPALDETIANEFVILRAWARRELPRQFSTIGGTRDVVHDVLVSAGQSGRSPVTVRRHGALQRYLRLAVRARIRDRLAMLARGPRCHDLEEALQDQADSLLVEVFLAMETSERYQSALQELSESERRLIVARVEMGYTWQELAVTFGLSVPAATMAARLALAVLSRKLRGELR